jgi:hypothetical protein
MGGFFRVRLIALKDYLPIAPGAASSISAVGRGHIIEFAQEH